MYTNSGILGTMKLRDIAVNLDEVKTVLDAAMSGEKPLEGQEFDRLTRWEEDMKRTMLHRAEMLGVTNVSNNVMKSF